MLMRKPACPVDYSLCNQTVTVYHNTGSGFMRTVFNRAYLDHKKTQTVDKTGNKEANSFLLVIPGATQAVFPGDKVLMGIGPEVTTREAWAAMVPATTPGLVVVSYADSKFWNGQMVHTEAGG